MKVLIVMEWRLKQKIEALKMKDGDILNKLISSLVEIDRKATLQTCEKAMMAGVSPENALEALSEGMNIIGERFEAGEYFLSELMMAGVILKDAQGIIKPHLKLDQVKTAGKVVIGTVEGDLHDIGKNIVIALLEASGFDVIDLDTNVPAEKFVEAVRIQQPDILGLSALLRATVPEMGKVIKSLDEAGLREKVKVIVGGLPLNREYADKMGADYYAEDAWKGLEIIRGVVEQS